MQKLLITSLLIGTAASALAAPLDYEIGDGSSVVPNTIDPGLRILTELDSGLSAVAFTIDDGISFSFPFFTIKANESAVNTEDPNDDTAHLPITATLDFAVPNTDAVITGVTFGGTVDIFVDNAFVEWDGPAIVVAGDRTFTVSLNNTEFSRGQVSFDEPFSFDFDLGNSSAQITATVTQISSNVPDGGATFKMMGSVLAGLAFFGRRLRR
jgi:hypothetical protein